MRPTGSRVLQEAPQSVSEPLPGGQHRAEPYAPLHIQLEMIRFFLGAREQIKGEYGKHGDVENEQEIEEVNQYIHIWCNENVCIYLCSMYDWCCVS